MNFNKGISTLVGIIIIVATAVVSIGGIYVYQYYSTPKGVKTPIVSTVPALLSFNIVPSEKSEQGTTYQEGAEAVLKANNLSKVEFLQRGGGTGIYTSQGGGLVGVGVKAVDGNEELWKLVLPSDRRFVEICALGYDFSNNKVEEICLNNVIGISNQTAGWKTYKNDEYGFEFQYPEGFFDKFYGPDLDKCSNSHPDTQKYSNRFIFEADQKGTANESVSMSMTIICTKLEKNKIDDFIQDLYLNGSDVVQKQIGGLVAYQTTAYSVMARESLHTFIALGDDTLQISFYNPGWDNDTVNQMLSTFKFIK